MSAAPSADPIAPRARRIDELDGIRGWAALSVFLFHLLWETFGQIYPVLRNPLTAGLLNGRLDVAIFFVLSGDALSTSFFRSGDPRTVIRAAAGRYPRLMIPVLAASVLVFVAMKLGLVHNLEAAKIVRREDWLGGFLTFEPHAGTMLRYGFRDVFYFSTHFVYLPFLWTMPIELLGSACVFALLVAHAQIRNADRVLAAFALALVVFDVFLACFVAGLLFSRLRASGRLDAWRRDLAPWQSLAALVLLYALAALMQTFNAHEPYLLDLVAPLTLLGLYTSRPAMRFFGDFALSRWLGRISFPLYLVHFVVLVTLTSALVVHPPFGWPPPIAAAFTCLVSVAVGLAAAALFAPIERLAHRVGRRAGRLVAG